MRFDTNLFSSGDLERAAQVKVTPELYAAARFETIKALCVYRHFYLRPLLNGLVSRTPRENAVIDLHYRLAALAISIPRLANRVHFQSLAGTARSIFEVGLDLALISKDSTNESVERFSAFTTVERYRWAEQTVEFYAGRPDPTDYSIAEQRALLANAAQTKVVDDLLLKHWNKKPNKHGKRQYPDSWTGMGVRQCAESLGWDERYVRNYKVLSWYIHGSAVGIEGLPPEDYYALAANSALVAADVLLDTYEILGKELRFSSTDQWDTRLEFLKQVAGLALASDRLAEPRLAYIEPAETEWLAPLLLPGTP